MLSSDETNKVERAASAAAGRPARREAVLVLTILFGLAAVVGLARQMEAARCCGAAAAEGMPRETGELYAKPDAARRISLSFNGLVADWYWLRALQYVGHKVLNHPVRVHLDDLSPLKLVQLAPMLEQATTLDPQFMAAYEYGAMVLPAIDEEAAVKLITKGIRANPHAWRLYQHLGYIHWQRGRFREAAAAYAGGARLAGAPPWMETMAAQMEVDGGGRDVARAIYARMYTEAGDEQIRHLALKRLLQLASLDERDRLRRVLTEYRARNGRCAAAWRDVGPALREAAKAVAPSTPGALRIDVAGRPLDPTDVPYLLDPNACEARLDEHSQIPQN